MFAHAHSSVPALARLLLKAQAELSSLLDTLPPAARAASHPLLNLQMGPVQFAMGVNASERSCVELSCTQGAQEYHLTLRSAQADQPSSVKARLVNRRTGETRELDGAAIFRGEVPEDFKPLHREVTAHLKAWLPEGLWTRLSGTPAQGASDAPSAQATDVSVTPPTADTAAPADNDAAKQAATAESPDAAGAANAVAEVDDGYRQYVLTERDGPDLRFTGKLLDAVRTGLYRGRWTEFHVYQTKGGKYVGVKLGRSLLLGEVDRSESKVADQLADLADFFGHSPLAKMLTQRLGIRRFVDIE